MLQTFRRIHLGKDFAVLGSGPSLKKYTGNESVSIAVNGAALTSVSYDYFLCGDVGSPLRRWFRASEEFKAVRILSSFIAPLDPFLYPDKSERKQLQEGLRPFTTKARSESNYAPLYAYAPKIAPKEPHAWFQYVQEEFGDALEKVKFFQDESLMLHGATISGVAIQVAALMGAKTIHLYGCSPYDETTNETEYFDANAAGGTVTKLQRKNLCHLIEKVKLMGIEVKVHS